MAQNVKHLVTVKGNVDILNNVAYGAKDLIFDWTRIEVPRGVFSVNSIFITTQGTEGAAGTNDEQVLDLIFAREIDGVAPSSLGSSNSAPTAARANIARRNIIGYSQVTPSSMNDDGNSLASFNIASSSSFATKHNPDIVLVGDPHTKATAGNQYIYVACTTAGGQDFGTGVLAAGAHAVSDGLTITVDGVDANATLAIGDEIVAVAANGSHDQIVGTITSLTATAITVDALGGAIADDDEICFRHPIVLQLGLQY
jgi:hypothetical protein